MDDGRANSAPRSRTSWRAGARRGSALAASLVASFAFGALAPAAEAQDRGKLRTIVTTDPELDDQNSLVRYLLRSSDFDTEGLVLASSGVHWKGDGRGTRWWQPGREYDRFPQLAGVCPCESWRWPVDERKERFIEEAVDRYEQAYPNLKAHDRGYPSPEYLRSKIRVGNVQFDSDISADTPGSDLIKQVLLDNEGGPVYLMAWGGPSTIARALKSIQLQYQDTRQWQAIYRKVTQKAVIVSWGTQDYSYRDYISVSWPGIVLRQASTSTWGYGARNVVLPEHRHFLSAEWTQANVVSKGPLGGFYRYWGDNNPMTGPDDKVDYFHHHGLTADELRAMGYAVWTPVQEMGSWISEGDTSTFLSLAANGLRSHVHPSWGGWGGRLRQSAADPTEWSRTGVADKDAQGATPPDYAAQRWFGDAQRDFQARLQWSVTPRFEDANHHPVVRVNGYLDRQVQRGRTVPLRARATDPDGDKLTYRWWQYQEAGVNPYPGQVQLTGADTLNARFTVPRDATPGQQIHLILQVTDDGDPQLTRYQRVVVTVR